MVISKSTLDFRLSGTLTAKKNMVLPSNVKALSKVLTGLFGYTFSSVLEMLFQASFAILYMLFDKIHRRFFQDVEHKF